MRKRPKSGGPIVQVTERDGRKVPSCHACGRRVSTGVAGNSFQTDVVSHAKNISREGENHNG